MGPSPCPKTFSFMARIPCQLHSRSVTTVSSPSNMSYIEDILRDMKSGFGAGYFIYAGVLLLVTAVPWFFLRGRIHNARNRRLWDSFVLALVFAPSVYGGDMGGGTFPATLVVAIGVLLRGANPRLLICSLMFVFASWVMLFCLLNLIAMFYPRHKAVGNH